MTVGAKLTIEITVGDARYCGDCRYLRFEKECSECAIFVCDLAHFRVGAGLLTARCLVCRYAEAEAHKK